MYKRQCTNSSYQDLSRAASIARQVDEKQLSVAAPLLVTPGSEQIRATAERDGMIDACLLYTSCFFRISRYRAGWRSYPIPNRR